MMKIERLNQLVGKLNSSNRITIDVQTRRVKCDAHYIRHNDDHITGDAAFRRQSHLKEVMKILVPIGNGQ